MSLTPLLEKMELIRRGSSRGPSARLVRDPGAGVLKSRKVDREAISISYEIDGGGVRHTDFG